MCCYGNLPQEHPFLTEKEAAQQGSVPVMCVLLQGQPGSWVLSGQLAHSDTLMLSLLLQ